MLVLWRLRVSEFSHSQGHRADRLDREANGERRKDREQRLDIIRSREEQLRMMTAKKPKALKSNHPSALAIEVETTTFHGYGCTLLPLARRLREINPSTSVCGGRDSAIPRQGTATKDQASAR